MADYRSRPLKTYARPITFAEGLSISQSKEKILEAWKAHQILLIQSETGSGKSTQIPKIALESIAMHEGQAIAITQPRRLAAQVLCSRLNHELGAAPGEAVGYHVRHQNRTLPHQFIKVMTEGILVQEASSDPLLSKYNVIILDEVHERSISIDLLCGILKPILKKRPELKIALLSATLEKDVFLSFFPQAYSLFFPGRSFPIQDYYWEGALETPILDRLYWALDLLEHGDRGDALVFCATEAEIHFFKSALEKHRPYWEYHVLYARLDPLKQSNVTKGSQGRRRVILATNIAETSLTIPGLSAVIDLGTHKILQYNPQLRISSYPIVPITQASIAQRRGRAGRTGPGTCFHLYTQEDALSRPQDRIPEIQRSSLAQVLLKILCIGQKIHSFSFVTEPHSAQMREALQTLDLLNLIDDKQELTALGRSIAHDPVDPRFSVILREAKKLHVGEEIAILVGFLSSNDPRLRPFDRKSAALKIHSQDTDYSSEFLTILNLYKRISRETFGLSKRKFHQYCEKNFLQPTLVDQWHAITEELCHLMNIERNGLWIEKEFHSLQIHRSLVSGFFDKVFLLQPDHMYRGARGIIAKSPLTEVGKISRPQWLISIAVETIQNTHRLRWVGPIAPMDLLHYGAAKLTTQLSDWQYCEQKHMAYLTETTLLWGLRVAGPRRRWALPTDKEARTVAITGLVLQEYPLYFQKVRSWFEPFRSAMLIAQRTHSMHLLRSPAEMVKLALSQWPQEIFDGPSLEKFQGFIPKAQIDTFFMGPVPCDLAELPSHIMCGHHKIEIRYTDPEESHDIELSLSEKLWNRYPGSAWVVLHPYYRRQIVIDCLFRISKHLKSSGETLPNIAEFFLSEYLWPKDLFSELKKFLFQYYEVPSEVCTWQYHNIPKRIIPTVWVESDNGDLHWMGAVDLQSSSNDRFNRISVESIRDRDKEMYDSATAGLYRYIPSESTEEIIYGKTEFFSWKSVILEDYAKYLKSVLSISEPGLIRPSDQVLLIQIILGSVLLPGEKFLLKSQEERIALKKRYELFWKHDKSTFDRIRSVLKNRSSCAIPKTPWAHTPALALQSGHFLCHLSLPALERCLGWFDALTKLDLRQREKTSLCQNFSEQWHEFLSTSKLESRCALSLANPVWALWFEWMMSHIFQPYRPLTPLSVKRALALCQSLQDFKDPWIN